MATRKTAASRNNASKIAMPTRVTRAAASRTPTMVEASVPKASTTEKPRSRKPLVNRNETVTPAQKTRKIPIPTKQVVDDGDREPVKAFLRIRPNIDGSEDSATPYLNALSDMTVQMTDLSGSNRIRMHPQTQTYTFNHVFPPETLQPEFFTKTTLPLVQDLLQGQNSLIFAYGVTNSGKTYTIQGGTEPNTAGLLPRTLDVVFNSLEGLHSSAPFRPVRISGIERGADDDPQYLLPEVSDENAIAVALGEVSSHGVDSTTVRADKNYEYSIWISYAEVYNEKVYDLLSTDPSDGESQSAYQTPQKSGALPRSGASKRLPRTTSSAWSNLASLACAPSSSDVLFVKRKALTLKKDPEGGGKYIAGLKCVRVRTAEEAKRVFRTGNINRRVFGTLTNAASSRSHGIFTLRAVKVHRADHTDVSVSRLSIVDLAGSERTKNTHTTGERLKEAGSINKSLMVLGQCMEAMRSNQRRLAAMLAAPGRGGIDLTNPTPGVKLAIIPFRHSKLTELFQDFFTGERGGRAVMIVNVNPYDTGFDENSHVMRFAALAREVTTAPASILKANIRQTPTPVERVFSGNRAPPHRRNVTIPTSGTETKKPKEAHVEIIEEDEDSDGDGEPVDLLVDALFEELEDLRIKLYESEMRCAIIETETREEVMEEMQARILDMERVFAKRLKQAVEQSEAKTDAKIDMLHHFGAFNANSHSKTRLEIGDASFHTIETAVMEHNQDNITCGSRKTNDDEEITDEEEELSDDPLAEFSDLDEADATMEESMTQSPTKYATLTKAEKKKLHSGPSVIGLRDEDMGIDELDADETMTAGGVSDEEEGGDDDETDDKTEGGSSEFEDDDDEEDEEEWIPEPKSKPTPSGTKKATKPSSAGVFTKLQKKMGDLSLYADEDDDEDGDGDGDNSIDNAQAQKGKRQSVKTENKKSVRRSTRQKNA